MLRPCPHPGCSTLVERGRCPIHQRHSATTGTRLLSPSDHHPNKPFYNSKLWKVARLAYMTEHPICEICNRSPTTQVHHKQSLEVRPDLRLDPTNFQSACQTCHSRETVRLDGGFGR